ncbi:hypothetical protein DL768_011318 [Monosporascus sp. mg162]|nr:hypothetical protein DL768_011318 [Monosporascus sp. mg162]
MRELFADQETGSFEVRKLDTSSYDCIRSFVERTKPLDSPDDLDALLPVFDRPGKVNMPNGYRTSHYHCYYAEVRLRNKAHRDLDGTLNGYCARAITRIVGYLPDVAARQLTDAAVNHGGEIHGLHHCSRRLKPVALIIDTQKERQIAERLWRETMNEFCFAGTQNIIDEASN